MHEAYRYFFSDYISAAEALLVLLEDARTTTRFYEFGSLSAKQILASGLLVQGDLTDVLPVLDAIQGATRISD